MKRRNSRALLAQTVNRANFAQLDSQVDGARTQVWISGGSRSSKCAKIVDYAGSFRMHRHRLMNKSSVAHPRENAIFTRARNEQQQSR